LTQPIADFVVSFGSDGRMHSQGVISEITKPGPLAAQLQQDKQVLAKEEKEVDAEAPTAKPSDIADGKLIVAEEIQLGHVSGSACLSLLLDFIPFLLILHSSKNVFRCHGRQTPDLLFHVLFWCRFCPTRLGCVEDMAVGLLGKAV
jgi:hypothetical protein